MAVVATVIYLTILDLFIVNVAISDIALDLSEAGPGERRPSLGDRPPPVEPG